MIRYKSKDQAGEKKHDSKILRDKSSAYLKLKHAFTLGNAKQLKVKWPCLTLQKSLLEYKQFCDGKFDCADLSDEFFCSTKRSHNENRLQRTVKNLFGNAFKEDSAVDFSKRMCVPHVDNNWRKKSCKICNPAEFVCDPLRAANEKSVCVNISNVCDGNKDCPNAEDERFCVQGNK